MRRPIERKQYLSIRSTERLAEAGIEPSVGSVGDSYAMEASPIVVASNGSAGATAARRLPSERNSYCVYQIDDSQVRLVMRELRTNGEAGKELFDQRLNIDLTHP